jgi:hypothetical protein
MVACLGTTKTSKTSKVCAPLFFAVFEVFAYCFITAAPRALRIRDQSARGAAFI